jgi:hypothetical protein
VAESWAARLIPSVQGDPMVDGRFFGRFFLICGALLAAAISAPGLADEPRVIDRGAFADRLRAMWLGECLANWTGRITEGKRTEPPFFTDEDWGTAPPGMPTIDFVLDQDPWWADDDTDIEYVYVHLLEHHDTHLLTPEQIAEGWIAHINDYIWVSNATARALMGRGVTPPSTGMGTANRYWLMIDAQLTTELFGALAPGMPDMALSMADLPIRTTSAGYASHAAQFFVVLYVLAPEVDLDIEDPPPAVWLVEQARRYIPDTSKSADIVDFVLADFIENPDLDDWESTRDRIYERYQLHAAENGFRYRAWYESSVNFATGIMALLYGQCDYRRTVQIGTLSGWDSDNPTATMGGLLGLIIGYDELRAQFPGQELSDRYWVSRTRDNLPDYLPDDEEAEDTFTLLAERMLPIIDLVVAEAGGVVDHEANAWMLPPPLHGDVSFFNPLRHECERSANNRVPLEGGEVITEASVESSPPEDAWPWPYGTHVVAHIANGFEQDFDGAEPSSDYERIFYSSQVSRPAGRTEQTFAVLYDRPVEVHTVRFVEGDHFEEAPISQGGWFEEVSLQVCLGDEWTVPPDGYVMSEPLDSDKPFQVIDFTLAHPLAASGIRLTGTPGGEDAFVTIAELDALCRPPPAHPIDIDGDGDVDTADLLALLAAWGDCPEPPEGCPADFDGDGDVDTADLLTMLANWG